MLKAGSEQVDRQRSAQGLSVDRVTSAAGKQQKADEPASHHYVLHPSLQPQSCI